MVRLPRPRSHPGRGRAHRPELHELHPRRDAAALALGRAGDHRARLRRGDPLALALLQGPGTNGGNLCISASIRGDLLWRTDVLGRDRPPDDLHRLATVPGDLQLAEAGHAELGAAFATDEEHVELVDVLRIGTSGRRTDA